MEAEQIFNEIKENSISIWEANGKPEDDVKIMKGMLFTTHSPIVFYRLLNEEDRSVLKKRLSEWANSFIESAQLI